MNTQIYYYLLWQLLFVSVVVILGPIVLLYLAFTFPSLLKKT